MGIKGFFKTKPPSEEEAEKGMLERMKDKGMLVKQETKKPSTFAAYGEYATDKLKNKREYAPKGYSKQEKEETEREQNGNGNPYSQGSLNSAASSAGNPYASLGANSNENPYGTQSSSTGSTNPYNSTNGSYGSSNHNNNPYGQQQSSQRPYDPYGGNEPQHSSTSSSNPYATSSNQQTSYNSSRIQNPSSQKRAANPYASQRSRQEQPQDDFTFEPALEKTQTNQSSRTQRTYIPGQQQQQQLLQEEEDLNDDRYADEDLNDDSYRNDYANEAALQQEEVIEETEEERLQREEDEDVEKIKGDIRFTKQESVASTRNTLRMAREAEESGKNTMGVLGAQAETLYNTERNLQLAEAQDKLAKEKVSQLHHYNRSMFKPSMKNPFTKNARWRAEEEKLKGERISYKMEQQRQRSELSSSTQRVKTAIDDSDGLGESIADKYRRDKIRKEAQQYQFEADSEDDEMETELGENLEEIGRVTGRLKNLAMAQGQEIERQNASLRNIEEKTDRLDVNLHVNSANLRRAK